MHSSSFYFVYEYATTNINRELTVDKNANDYQAIHNGQYDESFWEKKQVLSQTPVEKEIIKQFRKYNEFKKVFLK